MSWSYTKHDVGSALVAHYLTDEELRRLEQQNKGCINPALTAWEVAKDIVQGETLGSQSLTYTISINGHCNPEHVPVKGFVNDYMSIVISQANSEVVS